MRWATRAPRFPLLNRFSIGRCLAPSAMPPPPRASHFFLKRLLPLVSTKSLGCKKPPLRLKTAAISGKKISSTIPALPTSPWIPKLTKYASTDTSSHASPPPFFRSPSAISSSDVRVILLTKTPAPLALGKYCGISEIYLTQQNYKLDFHPQREAN